MLTFAYADTVSQEAISFGWQHVAQIGGALSVALLALIGVLLAIILKRQSGMSNIFQNTDFIQDVAAVKESLALEISERKTNREDHKADIQRLHERIDGVEKSVIDGIKSHCSLKQAACSGIVQSELDHQKTKLNLACSRITELQSQREEDWRAQRIINQDLQNKVKVNNNNPP
ncbi:MAG: hypothetical protein DRJ03_00890 [Chloroflexi bacterium]|nr:MAG: hypothetical protein DRJ03_00890 [Chloroflexota bacterium]